MACSFAVQQLLVAMVHGHRGPGYPMVVVVLGSWPAETETRKVVLYTILGARWSLHCIKQYLEICHGLYVDHSKFKIQLRGWDWEDVECNYTERHSYSPSVTRQNYGR